MPSIPGTIAALAASTLIATAAVAASAQAQRYEYAGKIVCGPQSDFLLQAAVKGFYATVINVRNPGIRVCRSSR